ncbi:MAG: hypothetical protein ACYCQI_16610 [Gammaproteobacteria bacterium]
MAHIRSAAAFMRLHHVDIVNNEKWLTMKINDKEEKVQILDGHVTNFRRHKLVAIGAYTREIILLDPESKLLNEAYDTIKEYIHMGKMNPNDVIIFLISFLRHSVFYNKASEEKITELASTHSVGVFNDEPIVPISAFFENGLGICRHHALLLCYFLDRLQHEGHFPKGTVYHHRDLIEGGAHIWVMFQRSQGSLYLIDSMFDIVRRFDVKDKKLLRCYGKKALDECIKRYNPFSKEEKRIIDQYGKEELDQLKKDGYEIVDSCSLLLFKEKKENFSSMQKLSFLKDHSNSEIQEEVIDSLRNFTP